MSSIGNQIDVLVVGAGPVGLAMAGRAQESISPEIKARLKALTVDVQDVKTPQRPPRTEVEK
ncbi:hypothetical protein WA1_23185 [Scytonema hofmannii PCC 7110]|uniref:Uncharacterized protein n=1 Tax=Scytonema hofmannii PCC 7110 TaxID=128403 RepID=A0A139X8K4_9CYAN|nr:hypothetical protein [Scytonema hofmannii]KYC41028.1 hypothetical protein WA1_23185 [Scytonema hofmannii PCC 7110]